MKIGKIIDIGTRQILSKKIMKNLGLIKNNKNRVKNKFSRE